MPDIFTGNPCSRINWVKADLAKSAGISQRPQPSCRESSIATVTGHEALDVLLSSSPSRGTSASIMLSACCAEDPILAAAA